VCHCVCATTVYRAYAASITTEIMSLHNQSDGALVEPTMTPLSTVGAGDMSFYAVSSRKSPSARRVISRCRNGGDLTTTSRTTTAARQSLLGRPVSARPSRRDARYRRCQVAVYNFLERPKNWRSILYHLFV